MATLLEIGTFVGQITTASLALWAAVKAGKATDVVKDQGVKIEQYHAAVNGQSEKLLAAVAGQARAEGKETGVAEERANPQSPAGS